MSSDKKKLRGDHMFEQEEHSIGNEMIKKGICGICNCFCGIEL